MSRWWCLFARFSSDRRGAISLLTALALPALIATLALGTEVSYWLVQTRKLQNAADSAVIAATIDGSAAYVLQAKAVAAQYGLVDGVAGVAVTGSNAVTCPDVTAGCYSVTVATILPNYLGKVVGYIGNASVGGVNGTKLSAIAFAKPSGSSREYCLVALAGNGIALALLSNGAPKADLSGCGVMSNTNLRCNGHDLRAAFGDAVGTNNGCGAIRTSYVPPFIDPYAARAASLPADPCGGTYPQSPSAAVTKWSGTRTLGSVTTICGDLQLTGNVTIVAPSDAVLILRNGELLTQGASFTTASGSNLALIFTGSNNASYQHIPDGSGALDITAPTTGTWAGVAMYQDPALTIGIQMPDAARKPKWAFSGLVYLPRVDLDFRGSVGKSGSGKRCTVIVANSITIKGTGLVLSTMECAAAGLTTPDNGATGRGDLVG